MEHIIKYRVIKRQSDITLKIHYIIEYNFKFLFWNWWSPITYEDSDDPIEYKTKKDAIKYRDMGQKAWQEKKESEVERYERTSI